jgi:hypothetical protein
MKHIICVLALVVLFAAGMLGQSGSLRPPVIYIHVHSTNTTALEVVNRMKALKSARWLLPACAGFERLGAVIEAGHYLPSLTLPCPRDRAPFVDRPCWEQPQDFPDTAWLRGDIRFRNSGSETTNETGGGLSATS